MDRFADAVLLGQIGEILPASSARSAVRASRTNPDPVGSLYVMATFRDLLSRRQGRDHRGRHRRRRRSASPPAASSCSTSASPTSTTRAPCPARSTSRAATSRRRSRAGSLDKTAPVVVYCAGGVRSAFAAKTLQELGYTDVVSMAGGFGKWKDEGRPWKTPVALTPDQRNRYQRHLLLPEVGVAGQAKLLGEQGADARRRRPRLARGAVPRRGRRRHDRHRRHGRGRCQQPAAPDPAQPRPHRRPQGRLGEEDARRC